MPTTPPTIDALPTPPSRDDPANFAARGDAFVAALPTFRSQTNSAASNVYANAVEAATAAGTATTNASEAAASASIATTKAAEALASANSASSSATSAAASWDSLDDRYLGAKVSDPTLDNDGNTLITGAIYWNSSSEVMKVWTGSAWALTYLPASGYLPISGGTMTGAITFAGGQTFPGAGDVTASGAQTLTNKTISVDSNTLSGIAASSFVLSNASGNIDGAAAQKVIPAGAVVGTTDTQTLTNKTISAGVYSGAVDQTGSVRGGITAVAALNIDCSLGNYFTKTINGNSTFTVSNVPASRAYAFTLELTHTSGTVTWFSGVQWPGGTAPTLTTGKVHLFTFVSDDGGTSWRGASQVNYNS